MKTSMEYEQFHGSLGEFAERYINGEKFYTLDNGGNAYELPDNIKAVVLKGYYQSGIFELVKPVWYDELGDGVLCWVWDNDQTPREVHLVTGYRHTQARAYQTYIDPFFEAKPLTKEEAMKFILGEL